MAAKTKTASKNCGSGKLWGKDQGGSKLQKKSKGSLKRQEIIDSKIDSKKKQFLIRKTHDRKKEKFKRCPSSKKRLNLIMAKKMFGDTRSGSSRKQQTGKKLESQIIKQREKLKKKKKKKKSQKKKVNKKDKM